MILADLLFRARSLFRRNTVESELASELEFHVSRQEEKYLASGMDRAEAHRRARLDFGGIDPVKEQCRQARGVDLIETFWLDIRYGVRVLRKSPGFATAALLTLALGIGANTAIFSIVYGTLLRPLPYQDSSGLVILNETTPKVGSVSVSYLNFLDWRAQTRTFSQMAAVHSLEFSLAGAGEPENVTGLAVSSDFLSLLGVRPIIGRDFSQSEDQAGTAPIVLLSYPIWQSHFGGDVNAIGRAIALNGGSFTVVGVLPPGFRWLDKVDVIEPAGVWIAKDGERVVNRSERDDTVVVGRMAPGFTHRQARAEMEGIAARLAVAYPGANNQYSVEMRGIRDVLVGDIRTAVLVLFAAVFLVLLIACANVANLFLMRGAARGREMALRVAVGASRLRLVRQVLAESFVMAGLGGMLGLAVGAAVITALKKFTPGDMMSGVTLGLNAGAFVFLGAAVVLCTFLFGLAPAAHSSRPDLQAELKEGVRASAGSGPGRLRNILATSEVALALILLVAAGLMIQSLYRLLSVDPGFHADKVLTLRVSLRTEQYAKEAPVRNFWQSVLERVRTLPGVKSAAIGGGVPFTGEHSRADITIEGMAIPAPGSFPHPDVHLASAGYSETLGVQLLAGRSFKDSDDENAPRVGMINAQIARHYFTGQDPIGKRFMFGHAGKDAPKWITIIGVLGDTRLYGLADASRLEVYVPFRQYPSSEMTLMVKSATDPSLLTNSIRGAIASVDRAQPVFNIASVKQLIDNSVSTRRLALVLLGQFGLLALILAGIGIYGVIAYSVAQRTHEIGIRLALGADHAGVLRLVFAQGAKIAAAGIAIGVVASLGLSTLMRSLLFSVGARDPFTLVGVSVVLALAAMAACYIPARRALRVDPVVALRHE